jgi:hypothetical protein
MPLRRPPNERWACFTSGVRHDIAKFRRGFAASGCMMDAQCHMSNVLNQDPARLPKQDPYFCPGR